MDGTGAYSRITIAEAAYDSHVAHGDAGIGDPVPGMAGYAFDSDCLPELVDPIPGTYENHIYDGTTNLEGDSSGPSNLPRFALRKGSAIPCLLAPDGL